MNAMVRPQQGTLVAEDEATTLLAVISRAARDESTDVEKMERLMAMYERVEAKRAETAFNEAMTEAQKRVGRVSADATNPQTRSQYATYAKLDSVLRPIYTECGFALSFDTGQEAPPDYVRVLCYVSHSAGFSRTYHVDMPADGKGAKGGDVMTKTHAFGSGVSYGMRYLLKMIFNVAIGEEDDDGNRAGKKREPTGKPQDGMRIEDFDEQRQIIIRENADAILEYANDGQINEAAKMWRDCTLSHEEKAAVWFLLPSHHRTAINRYFKR